MPVLVSKTEATCKPSPARFCNFSVAFLAVCYHFKKKWKQIERFLQFLFHFSCIFAAAAVFWPLSVCRGRSRERMQNDGRRMRGALRLGLGGSDVVQAAEQCASGGAPRLRLPCLVGLLPAVLRLSVYASAMLCGCGLCRGLPGPAAPIRSASGAVLLCYGVIICRVCARITRARAIGCGECATVCGALCASLGRCMVCGWCCMVCGSVVACGGRFGGSAVMLRRYLRTGHKKRAPEASPVLCVAIYGAGRAVDQSAARRCSASHACARRARAPKSARASAAAAASASLSASRT